MTTRQNRPRLPRARRKTATDESLLRKLRLARDAHGGRVSLRDLEPKDDGLLLVGMCTIAAVAKGGHFFEGTYGRRVWKKLAAAGLHHPSESNDDETWAAYGNGITDLVKRPVHTNDSLKEAEIAAGVQVLRKKVRRWRPRAVLFAFKNVAEAALGARRPSPGPLAAFEGVPTFLLTGPYAKPEAAAEEAARLGALRS